MRRTIRFVLAVVPLLAILGLVRNDHLPVALKAAAAAVAVLAAATPTHTLLIVAAVGPFSGLILTMAGSPPTGGFEVLVLALLAGWLAKNPPGPSIAVRRAPPTMWFLVAAAVAFLAMTAAIEWHRVGPALGVVQMRHLIEGGALFAAVLELTSARPALAFPVMRILAMSAATMAMVSITWMADVPADVSGAGLYCALVVGEACGMAASARGRRRWGWSIAVVLIVAGLIGAGSRSALGWVASAVAFTALWGRSRDYVSAGLLAGVLAFLIASAVGRSGIVDEWTFPFWIVLALAVLASRVRSR